jgi:hypothetical protein
MPAKGSHYNLPDREQVISKKLWESYKEKYNSDISYVMFTNIIKESNKKIANLVSEDEYGFKLPENLGYMCVIKYKTKKKAINWGDTKKYGKIIYYLNLHSFGYRYHIKWFKTGISRFPFNEIYKSAPLRTMRDNVSKKIRSGKDYIQWTLKDFWENNKLEKILHKKILKTEKLERNESY